MSCTLGSQVQTIRSQLYTRHPVIFGFMGRSKKIIKHRVDSMRTEQNEQYFHITLRLNGCDSVSNHQPHDCLLNRLFRCRSKKTSQLHVTGLCVGNSQGTSEFPAQMASNAENVSIWWRHHEMHLVEWKLLCFDSNFTEVCSQKSKMSALVKVMACCCQAAGLYFNPMLTKIHDAIWHH